MPAIFCMCCIAFFLFPSCTTTQQRAFIRRDANVRDYAYFPSCVIPKGNDVHRFIAAENLQTEEALLKELGQDDLQKIINRTRTQALIIIRGNTIELEKYGKNYSRESTVTSFSIAKSFNSAMAGCMIAGGYIKGADDPVTDYVPELAQRDARFRKISIRHLMAMSSGIMYQEKGLRADDTETYYNPDLRILALTNTKIQEDPGIHFLYNNYNPILLGLVIERVTNQSVSSYMSRTIWSKIGAESDATWSLDSNEDSFEKMESGINATAVDFARFACLYRDHGIVDGTQVIDGSWIDFSLKKVSDDPDYYSDAWGKQIVRHGGYYALGWYVLPRDGASSDFFAFGNKGQILYISPAADMVIARFGEQYGMDPWKYLTAFYRLCTQEMHALPQADTK